MNPLFTGREVSGVNEKVAIFPSSAAISETLVVIVNSSIRPFSCSNLLESMKDVSL
jgi:hypothetical protein